MRTLTATALSTCLGMMIAANAQAEERFPRWYVGVEGGANFREDTDLSIPGSATQEIGMESGFGFSGSLGYKPHSNYHFFNQSRFEVEYNIYYSQADDITVSGVTSPAQDTSETVHGGFVNWFYDFGNEGFYPSAGVGLGFIQTELDVAGATADDTSFAYQLHLAMNYTDPMIPNVDFAVGYKYLSTFSGEVDSAYSVATTGAERDFAIHALEAGARFNF